MLVPVVLLSVAGFSNLSTPLTIPTNLVSNVQTNQKPENSRVAFTSTRVSKITIEGGYSTSGNILTAGLSPNYFSGYIILQPGDVITQANARFKYNGGSWNYGSGGANYDSAGNITNGSVAFWNPLFWGGHGTYIWCIYAKGTDSSGNPWVVDPDNVLTDKKTKIF